MASLTLSSRTTTSLTVYVSGLDSGYSYDDRVTKWYVDGTLKKTVYGDPSPGATSGSSVTLSSLSAGTIYSIKAEIQYYAGTSTLKTSTITASFYTTPNITLSFPRVWSNAIELSISKSGDFGNRYVQWGTSSSSFSSTNRLPSSGYSTASPYKPIVQKISGSNLSSNTTYYFRVSAATDSSGTNLITSAKTGNTKTAKASAGSVVSSTDTTITCEVASFSYYSYQRKVYFQAWLNDSQINEAESGVIAAYATESGEVTITGLSPGTTYTIRCYVYLYGDQSTTLLNTFNGTTTGQAITVTPWSWTSANSTTNPSHTAEATAAQTQAARNACQNKTAVSNFKYQVWNDLVYKVYEYRKAKGKTSWNEHYASLSDTLMTSSSKTLTATRYNSMKYNLGEVYSTGISDVVSGVTEVNGTTHFLNFVTKLNQAINAL